MKTFIPVALTLALAMAVGCESENEQSGQGSPIRFSATVEPFNVINPTDASVPTLRSGDLVGIAVNATKEMTYKVSDASSSIVLEAGVADITTDYGQRGYACVPASGAANFLSMGISVPASQTITDGRNPNLVNSMAYTAIEDGKAAFRFSHYGAVLSLSLSSVENLEIKSMTLTATSPASGSYLAGAKAAEYSTLTEFCISDNVSNGSNTIEIAFPENLKLSAEAQHINVATLPFSTKGSGLKLVLLDADDHSCTMNLLDGESEIGENGAITMEAGDWYNVNVGEISIDDFDIPAEVTVHVINKSTNAAMTDHDLYVYSVTENGETLYSTVKTDADGKANMELNPGTWKFAAGLDETFGHKWNTLTETLYMNDVKDLTLEVLPIIFADDFDWITSDMGGSSKTLVPYYESYDPPACHSAAKDEAMFKESTSEAQAKLAEIGWEWTTTDFAYFRPGVIKFGKKNGTGSITTPKLSKYYDGVPSSVLLRVNAISWNNISNGAWTYEKSQLTFTIIGAGSFSATSEETSYTSGLLNSGTPPDFYTLFDLPIYNATGETQVKISSVKQSSGTQWRCMIDDVRITPLIQ